MKTEIEKDNDRQKEIIKTVIFLLGHVDFTMGCNGEKAIAHHVARLVEFYNDHQ